MRIREIIFQGVYGSDSPVRLATAPGVDRMQLPASVGVDDVQGLMLAVFFPRRIPQHVAAQFRENTSVKLAVVFEHADQTYRVLRREEASSLRLQADRDAGFQTLADGAEATHAYLQTQLGLPEFETFVALNLWRFDDDALHAPVDHLDQLDADTRELVDEYQRALRVESLDDRIAELEADIDDQRDALGKGARIEDKLAAATAKLDELSLGELSDDDFELLSVKDDRLAEFDAQLDRLLGQEEDERRDVERKMPDRPWKDRQFWAGIVVGAASLVVSAAFEPTLRVVALVNVVGGAMVAWVLLKYFTGLERASVHQVRLESIKRRLNQVREDEVSFRDKIGHLLIHAGVDDENHLYERVEMSRKLEDIVAQLESKMSRIRQDPAYRDAESRLATLEEQLADVADQRAELPDHAMSSFQLESDLRELGVEPHAALAALEDDSGPDDGPAGMFERLKSAAERAGQWRASGLDQGVRKMWSKICAHVLGQRFTGVELTGDGHLRIADMSDEQLAMWARTRGSEQRVVGAALALALHVNAPDQATAHMSTVWVAEPADTFGSQVAEAFDDVFESAAKKSHIVLAS